MTDDPLNYILEEIRGIVSSVDADLLEEFVEDIATAKRIFIYGAGRSGLVGQLFSVRLVQMGLDVHFIGEMTTPIIAKDDLTILVSNTGDTMSVVQTANIARRIGCKVVGITGNSTNKLAQASSTVIVLNQKGAVNHEYAPMGTIFEGSVGILFDSLVPSLMKRLKTNEKDMRKRHAIWV